MFKLMPSLVSRLLYPLTVVQRNILTPRSLGTEFYFKKDLARRKTISTLWRQQEFAEIVDLLAGLYFCKRCENLFWLKSAQLVSLPLDVFFETDSYQMVSWPVKYLYITITCQSSPCTSLRHSATDALLDFIEKIKLARRGKKWLPVWHLISKELTIM